MKELGKKLRSPVFQSYSTETTVSVVTRGKDTETD